MKKKYISLSLVFLVLPILNFAQGGSASSQSATIQRMNSSRNEMMQSRVLMNYDSHNHSKFIVSKQRQINGFKKLIVMYEAKIPELEAEISVLQNSSDKDADKDKIIKKIERKTRFLTRTKRDLQKFKDEIIALESQMTPGQR